MATSTTSEAVAATPTTQALTQVGVRGALLGAGASVAMGAFAMMAAATYQGLGFFTPLYHIASTFISPSTLMTSMQQAATGHTFYLAAGPALLGAVIHMMVGAMYAVPFAVLAARLRLGGRLLVAGATAWGAVVFVVSSFVGLPLAAAVLGSGDQITRMAAKVGYGTFLAEHLAFGLALGLLLVARRRSPHAG